MGNAPKSRKTRVANVSFDDKSDMYVNSLFSEFIAEKKALGLTEDTLKAYRATYDKFDKYFGDKAEKVGDITSHLFIEWTNAMRDEGLAAATINHHLGGIRPFMYWCMEDIRQYVPYFKIRLVKRQEEMPKDYTLEEVELLLKRPDKKATFTEWRSWAVANFVIGAGTRVGTIVEIRMCDINLKDGTVFYRHTKNKKLQTANISPVLARTLTDYISKWRTRDNNGAPIAEDNYLFCNSSNEQLSRDALKMAYGKYAKSRGVSKTSLHGLRHTFAREWYLNGGDVVQLSKVLGHSTIHMSEHYMNVYADSAKDKFIQCNPLENIAHGRGNARRTVKRTD
ncbi:tyrosine recombinase XerD [Clostridia bacterium]|nr:tyrosine recombinase XerD [Clostridia bacterium]